MHNSSLHKSIRRVSTLSHFSIYADLWMYNSVPPLHKFVRKVSTFILFSIYVGLRTHELTELRMHNPSLDKSVRRFSTLNHFSIYADLQTHRCTILYLLFISSSERSQHLAIFPSTRSRRPTNA
jgi:hypothetical protein